MTVASQEWQSRTELLGGQAFVAKLASAHVLVVGLGGVGGYVAEMLCRAGVGEMTIVDGDRVQASNRNRQLIALSTTEDRYKTDLFEKRLNDIHPGLKLHKITEFLKDERTAAVAEHPIQLRCRCHRHPFPQNPPDR